MKLHLLIALMAIILSACASHERDVASVQDESGGVTNPATPTSGRTQEAVMDGTSSRGEHSL